MHFVSDFLLPSLSAVLERLWDDTISGDLPVALGLTLARTFAGFAHGRVGRRHHRRDHRASAAWCAGSSIRSSRSAMPLPKIAFLPIFILWFGVFDWSKIAMVAFSSVFPVVVATWAATENVDKYLVWSAESLGVDRRALLWQIVLPVGACPACSPACRSRCRSR